MYNPRNIADRIKRTAKSKSISLKTMLSDCNLGINLISQLANGQAVTYVNFAKIADYLDCSVDYLLGRTDNNSSNSNSNITNSTVVQGINHSSVIMKNSSELTLTDEEIELLRIFKMLDVKHRHRLLELAFELEDEFKKNWI